MKNNQRIVKWLMEQATPAKKYWYYSGISGSASAICYIYFSRYVSFVAGDLLNGNSIKKSLMFMAGFFLLLRIITQFAFALFNLKAGEKVARRIRKKLYPALLNSLWLDSSKGTYYFSESVKRLVPFYERYLPSAIQSVLVPTIVLFFVFPINWIVGCILLLAYFLIPMQMMAAGFGAESIHKKQLIVVSRLSSLFQERIQAMPTIKRFGQVKEETRHIDNACANLNSATMKMMKVAMLSSGLMEFFSTFAMAIVAIYIGMGLLKYIQWGFSSGGIQLDDAMYLLMLAPYFFLPLRKFAAAYHDRNDAIAVAEQLIPILGVKTANIQKINLISPFENISLDRLSFCYPERIIPAINEVSLQLDKPGILLLSGPSGSGKSTLLLLLSGYLKPYSGEIVVNNLTTDESLIWLRQNTAWMGQKTFLFKGTIEKNIQMNSHSNINKNFLVKEACLQDIIENKKEGWQYAVGENGFGLSDGEKQRIGLARLLHHHKPVLLLDEPTAHVDALTSNLIFTAIQKLATTHCIVLASHQKAAFEIADRIVCLEDGNIKDIIPGKLLYQTNLYN